MRKLFCIVCVCMFFALTACTSKKAVSPMKIYSGDKKMLLISIDNNDEKLKLLDIINNYKDFDGNVELDKPDYIVDIGPVDNENNSKEYKFWIKNDDIIFLSPQFFDEPSTLSISTHLSDDFFEILKKI